jgi:hypothetical protein
MRLVAGRFAVEDPFDRFWAKVQKSDDPDACWPWTGAAGEYGHGRFWDGSKLVIADRWWWEQNNGPVPEGLFVLHSCDNGRCVYLGHLFLGTQADNIADMMAKGRHADMRGEKHSQAILTVDQIKLIRQDTRFQREIAAAFGVSRSHVGRIRAGERWVGEP